MVVVGELVDGLDCSPLAGVKVHVWHEGPKGGYRDKYRSVLFTDAAGKFRYSGPSMRKSEEADPHVHFLVELPSGPFPFTTGVGLFERGRTQKANIVVVLPASEAEEPAL